jgi:hypothetical protein
MKLFAMALLALSLATPSFAADETMTVTGSRTPEGSTPPAFGGGGAPGRPAAQKPQRFGEGEEGGSGGLGANAQLIAIVMQEYGAVIRDAVKKDMWLELDVTVTTPSGVKVDVHIKAGYGSRTITKK